MSRLFFEAPSGDRDIDFAMLRDVFAKAGGTADKECPVCGFVGRFKAFGSPPRWNALCPSCGALERHRLLALVLQERPVIRPGSLVLHFAPEQCVTRLLKKPGIRYVTADLLRNDVERELNIESIALDDNSCDVVACSHVLEHVNDRLALSELHRILKPGGVLIAMVPIIEGCEITYEDPSITRAGEREIHFGQHDHVRTYGRDFSQRLLEAGFEVQVRAAFGRQAVRYGLVMGEKVFLCHKAGG